MPDAIEYQEQSDFSAGAFPGMERIAPNGVEQCINGLVLEDGAIRRRGGLVFKSPGMTASTTAPVLWDGFLAGSARTMMVGTSRFYALADDDAANVNLGTIADYTGRRGVEIANMVVLSAAGSSSRNKILVWGGTNQAKTAYSTGTAALTQGSKDVTGTGTSWLANIRAGQVLSVSLTTTRIHHATAVTYNRAAVVAAVNSNTSLTLVDEWPYDTGAAYTYSIADAPQLQLEPLSATGERVVLAATMGKLFAAQGNKIYQSGFGLADGVEYPAPWNFNGLTDFHLLPAGAVVIGLEPVGSNLLVFTTGGVWLLSNVAFDITDDFGNPQQQLQQVSRDIVLWGETGIASWQGQTIVPAVDDLYLAGQDGSFQPITGGARTLYRSYVKAGYTLGQAAIHRGHYFLPVVNGTTEVSVLVWRLDMPGVPFVQWETGADLLLSMVNRSGRSGGSTLLAQSSTTLLDLTGSFEPPTGDNDEQPRFLVRTRTLSIPGSVAHTWRRVRARWDYTGTPDVAPLVSSSYETNEPGSAIGGFLTPFQYLTGDTPLSWSLAQQARLFRVRLEVIPIVAVDDMVLRQIEVGVRRSGAV